MNKKFKCAIGGNKLVQERIKRAMLAFVLSCAVLLCGCGPSLNFLRDKERGLYPDTSDFPNTKWSCRELDMYIYMFGFEEKYMIGVYEVDSKSYRIVATFWYGSLNFKFYSSTDISVSKYSDSMVNCEPISCGYINTSYSYKTDTETIVCSVQNYESVKGEAIPKTLTFEKVGEIAKHPDVRWYAKEIDMYLDSFSDVKDYFRGEITVNGVKNYVHAFEIGNNGYFMLSIENGKVNNLRPQTTYPLICMYFETDANKIIARVSDEYSTEPAAFPYWPYGTTIITFEAVCS